MFDLIDFWVCLSIHNIYKAIRPYPVSGIRYPVSHPNKNNPKTKHNQALQNQNQNQTPYHNPYQQPTTKIPLPSPIPLPTPKIPKILLFTKPPTPTQSLHPPQKPHYPQYCKVGRENPKNSRRCGVGDFAQKPTLNQYLQAKKKGTPKNPL